MACGREGWKATIVKMSYQADHGLRFRLKILCLEGRSMEAAALAADVIFAQAINKRRMELMGSFDKVEVGEDESLLEQLSDEDEHLLEQLVEEPSQTTPSGCEGSPSSLLPSWMCTWQWCVGSGLVGRRGWPTQSDL